MTSSSVHIADVDYHNLARLTRERRAPKMLDTSKNKSRFAGRVVCRIITPTIYFRRELALLLARLSLRFIEYPGISVRLSFQFISLAERGSTIINIIISKYFQSERYYISIITSDHLFRPAYRGQYSEETEETKTPRERERVGCRRWRAGFRSR